MIIANTMTQDNKLEINTISGKKVAKNRTGKISSSGRDL